MPANRNGRDSSWAALAAGYLLGRTEWEQSGFHLGSEEWERLRKPIADVVEGDGAFLDLGCANGLLLESIVHWCGLRGHAVQPFGLELSDGLLELAKSRLPEWRHQLFQGDALTWEPPRRFDYVRTELNYVPPNQQQGFVERLRKHFLNPGGKLILCSYGSTKPDGERPLEFTVLLRRWGISYEGAGEFGLGPGEPIATRLVFLQ